MTHSTVKHLSEQEKALVKARTDAAFQRFMFKALSVRPNQGQKFDRATVEGFCHA